MELNNLKQNLIQIFLLIDPKKKKEKEKVLIVILQKQNEKEKENEILEMNQLKQNELIWYSKLDLNKIFKVPFYFVITEDSSNKDILQFGDSIERKIQSNPFYLAFFEYGKNSNQFSEEAKLIFLDILLSFDTKHLKIGKMVRGFQQNLKLLKIQKEIVLDYFKKNPKLKDETDKHKVFKLILLNQFELIPDIFNPLLINSFKHVYDEIFKYKFKNLFKIIFFQIPNHKDKIEIILIVKYIPVLDLYKIEIPQFQFNPNIKNAFKEIFNYFFFEKNQNKNQYQNQNQIQYQNQNQNQIQIQYQNQNQNQNENENQNQNQNENEQYIIKASINSLMEQFVQKSNQNYNSFFQNLDEMIKIETIPFDLLINILEEIKDKLEEIQSIIEFIQVWKPFNPLIEKLEKLDKNKEQKIIRFPSYHFNYSKSNIKEPIKEVIDNKIFPNNQIPNNFYRIIEKFLIEEYTEILNNRTFPEEYLNKLPKEIEIQFWKLLIEQNPSIKFISSNTNKLIKLIEKFNQIPQKNSLELWIYLMKLNQKFNPPYSQQPFSQLNQDYQDTTEIKNYIDKQEITIQEFNSIPNEFFNNLLLKLFPGFDLKTPNQIVELFEKQKEIIKNFMYSYIGNKPTKPDLKTKIINAPQVKLKDAFNFFGISKELIERMLIYNQIFHSKWVSLVWKKLYVKQQAINIIETIKNSNEKLNEIKNKFVQKLFTFRELENYIDLRMSDEDIDEEVRLLNLATNGNFKSEILKKYKILYEFDKNYPVFIHFCEKFELKDKEFEEFKSIFGKSIETKTLKDVIPLYNLYQKFIQGLNPEFFSFLSDIFPIKEVRDGVPIFNNQLFNFMEDNTDDWSNVMELIDEEFFIFEAPFDYIRNRLEIFLSEKKSKITTLSNLINLIKENEKNWKKKLSLEFNQTQQSRIIKQIFISLPEINDEIKRPKIETPKKKASKNLENILSNPKKIFKFEIKDEIEFECEIFKLKEKNDQNKFSFQDFVDINMLLLENEEKDKKVQRFTGYIPLIQEMINLFDHFKKSIHPKFIKGYSIKNEIKSRVNLQNIIDEMKKLKKEWTEIEKEVTANYFYSFFYSYDQIKIIYNSLKSNNGDEIKKIEPILHLSKTNSEFKWERNEKEEEDFKLFIQELHQKLESQFDQIKEIYNALKSKKSNKKEIEKIRQSLDLLEIDENFKWKKDRNDESKDFRSFKRKLADIQTRKKQSKSQNELQKLFSTNWPPQNQEPIFVIQIQKEMEIYEFLTTLYLKYTKKFPTKEQILFCNKNTTEDDISRFIILFKKSQTLIDDQLFSIIFPHKLSKKLQKILISKLKTTRRHNSQTKQKSIMLFSLENSNETRNYFSSFFTSLKQDQIQNEFKLEKAKKKNKDDQETKISKQIKFIQKEWEEEFPERSDKMKVFISKLAGSGKTFQIKKELFEINSKTKNQENPYKYCHIDILKDDPKSLIQKLIEEEQKSPNSRKCFHFDLAYSVGNETAELIWLLLIFGNIEDKRCSNPDSTFIFKPDKHLIYFEIPSSRVKDSEFGLKYFPSLKFIEQKECKTDSETICKYKYEIDENQIIIQNINENIMICSNFLNQKEQNFNNINFARRDEVLLNPNYNLKQLFDKTLKINRINENEATFMLLNNFWNLFGFYIKLIKDWNDFYPETTTLFANKREMAQEFRNLTSDLIIETIFTINKRSFSSTESIEKESQCNKFTRSLSWDEKMEDSQIVAFSRNQREQTIDYFKVLSQNQITNPFFSEEIQNILKLRNINK
ncbi:defective chorion-1 protein [Anaeramoeba ignava]|uniref:Defective chorion-1 protein n=1 Tax=Anaeramoeba ignava TaxID=1746090 RepID=A0A9Q0LD86_ANAIG|nr:defective chorion-1 protein [Anaeramoeba ignava]